MCKSVLGAAPVKVPEPLDQIFKLDILSFILCILVIYARARSKVYTALPGSTSSACIFSFLFKCLTLT